MQSLLMEHSLTVCFTVMWVEIRSKVQAVDSEKLISQTWMGSYKVWSKVTENTGWVTLLPSKNSITVLGSAQSETFLFFYFFVCVRTFLIEQAKQNN